MTGKDVCIKMNYLQETELSIIMYIITYNVAKGILHCLEYTDLNPIHYYVRSNIKLHYLPHTLHVGQIRIVYMMAFFHEERKC